MDLNWLVIVIQLIFLEGILSIDNAAVLGAMVIPLSPDRPVPWPPWLAALGHRFEPIVGPQRSAALKVGLLGAYVGRGLMLLVAHIIIRNPWLQLIGGAYLVYLAVDYLAEPNDGDDTAGRLQRDVSDKNFWNVVLAVELTDLAFSLDNVVAAVALSSHILIVMLGVALGILTMRFAAGIFTHLVEREPDLEPAAYVLILVIGVRFFAEHMFNFSIPSIIQFGVSLFILLFAVLYGHWSPLHILQPVFNACERLFQEILRVIRLGIVQPATDVVYCTCYYLAR